MTQASTVHADNGPRGDLLEGGVAFVRPDVPDYAEVAAAFEESMSSGLLTKGPQLEKLEQEAAAWRAEVHKAGRQPRRRTTAGRVPWLAGMWQADNPRKAAAATHIKSLRRTTPSGWRGPN